MSTLFNRVLIWLTLMWRQYKHIWSSFRFEFVKINENILIYDVTKLVLREAKATHRLYLSLGLILI